MGLVSEAKGCGTGRTCEAVRAREFIYLCMIIVDRACPRGVWEKTALFVSIESLQTGLSNGHRYFRMWCTGACVHFLESVVTAVLEIAK